MNTGSAQSALNMPYLGQHILRSALPSEDWGELLEHGRTLYFHKGDVIFSRGMQADNIYLIVSGRVEISLVLADGQKAILNEMGPDEIFGEISVLDRAPRSADALAASDDVKLIAIGRKQVYELIDNSSQVVFSLISELCKRVRNASEMFEVKSEKSAQVRLARSLLRLAAKWGTAERDQTVVRGFSQSELAGLAGLARENVNRVLKQFEDEGLLRRDGEALILSDVDALANMAQI